MEKSYLGNSAELVYHECMNHDFKIAVAKTAIQYWQYSQTLLRQTAS